MFVWTCAPVHVGHTHVCECMYMEARGWLWESSIISHLLFGDRVSHWTRGSLTRLAGMTSSPRDLPVSSSHEGVMDVDSCISLLKWMVGIWTQVLILVQQGLYLLTCVACVPSFWHFIFNKMSHGLCGEACLFLLISTCFRRTVVISSGILEFFLFTIKFRG